MKKRVRRRAFKKNKEEYHIKKFRKCMKVDKRLILVARYYFLPTASEFLINFVKNVVQLLEEGTGCCSSSNRVQGVLQLLEEGT